MFDEGAQAWVTPLDIPSGQAGTLCVRLIQSNQPIAGANVTASLNYPSSTITLGPAVTGGDGVTALTFTVPSSISGLTVVDVGATVTYQQQVYMAQTCFNAIGNQLARQRLAICS